jgi:uncharacterized protein YodC (DUF2158 family)
MAEALEVGSLVRLNSGGPEMMVLEMIVAPDGAWMVVARWNGGAQMFPVQSVHRIFEEKRTDASCDRPAESGASRLAAVSDRA